MVSVLALDQSNAQPAWSCYATSGHKYQLHSIYTIRITQQFIRLGVLAAVIFRRFLRENPTVKGVVRYQKCWTPLP